MASAAGAAGMAGAASEAGTITADAQPVAVEYRAYGRVQPIAVLPVTAGEPGVVTGLRVVPGSPVTAGELIATLTGPEIQSLLVSRESEVRSSSAGLAAAQRALAAEKEKLAGHLTTRVAVGAAESALAAATAALEIAQRNCGMRRRKALYAHLPRAACSQSMQPMASVWRPDRRS